MISDNLKMSDQCTIASKKVNMMLGLISRNFDHKFPEVMKRQSNTQFNLGYRTTLKTKTYWKEYRDEKQKSFLHCMIYCMKRDKNS